MARLLLLSSPNLEISWEQALKGGGAPGRLKPASTNWQRRPLPVTDSRTEGFALGRPRRSPSLRDDPGLLLIAVYIIFMAPVDAPQGLGAG